MKKLFTLFTVLLAALVILNACGSDKEEGATDNASENKLETTDKTNEDSSVDDSKNKEENNEEKDSNSDDEKYSDSDGTFKSEAKD